MRPTMIKKFLCVFINCWCLIFTGLPTIAFAQPTTNTKPMTAAECPNSADSAYQFDKSVNRCVLKASSTAQRKMFQECDALEGDQKAACYEKMRNQNLNEAAVTNCQKKHGSDTNALKDCISAIDGSSTGMADDFEGSGGLEILGIGIGGTVAGLAIANMMAKEGKKASGCTSATMLKVTGIGSLVGQLYLKLGAKGDFKDLEKNYDEQVAAGDDAQFAAYDYLEAQQNEIVSVAEKHEKVYGLTALGYGATALIAGVEMTGLMTPCAKPSQGGAEGEGGAEGASDGPGSDSDAGGTAGDNTANGAGGTAGDSAASDAGATAGDSAVGTGDEAVESQVAEGQPVDKGQISDEEMKANPRSGEQGLAMDPLKVEATKLAGQGVFASIRGFLSTSPGILTLSLAGALVNSFLKKKATDQADQSKENAQKVARLKGILEEALASSSYCKSRDDLSTPRCYCFNPDNTRNTNRTNSETCQALFANLDKSLFAEATDYGSNKAGKPQGCFRVDGVFDQECKCKEVKNAQGQDGCFNVPINVNQVAALGPNTGIPNVVGSFNSLFSGGLGSGELQSGRIGQLAARVGAARKQVLGSVAKKLGAKKSNVFDLQAQKLLRSLAKNIPKKELASASSQLASSLGAGGSLGSNANIQKAIEKSGIVISSVSRGGGARGKARSAKKKVGFDLYGNENKNGASDRAVMSKKYDYSEAQDDIVERKDVSIWKVISNRYNTSGLRRLFDDGEDEL